MTLDSSHIAGLNGTEQGQINGEVKRLNTLIAKDSTGAPHVSGSVEDWRESAKGFSVGGKLDHAAPVSKARIAQSEHYLATHGFGMIVKFHKKPAPGLTPALAITFGWNIYIYATVADRENLNVLAVSGGIAWAATALCATGAALAVACATGGALIGYIVAEEIYYLSSDEPTCGVAWSIPWYDPWAGTYSWWSCA